MAPCRRDGRPLQRLNFERYRVADGKVLKAKEPCRALANQRRRSMSSGISISSRGPSLMDLSKAVIGKEIPQVVFDLIDKARSVPPLEHNFVIAPNQESASAARSACSAKR